MLPGGVRVQESSAHALTLVHIPLRLMKGRTAVAQKAQNSENNEKAQRTNKR